AVSLAAPAFDARGEETRLRRASLVAAARDGRDAILDRRQHRAGARYQLVTGDADAARELAVTQGAARCRQLLKHSIERIDGSPTILLRGGAGGRHPADERPVSLLDLLPRVVESAGARPEEPGAAQKSPIVVVKRSSAGGFGD